MGGSAGVSWKSFSAVGTLINGATEASTALIRGSVKGGGVNAGNNEMLVAYAGFPAPVFTLSKGQTINLGERMASPM